VVDFQDHVVVRVAAVAWSDKWTVLVLLESTGKGLVVGKEIEFWFKRFIFVDALVEAEEGKSCEASIRMRSKFCHWLAQGNSVPGPLELISNVDRAPEGPLSVVGVDVVTDWMVDPRSIASLNASECSFLLR
jgi:hypothetical protein